MMGASPRTRNLSPQLAIDRLLLTGLRLGSAGKRQAINRVLELLPEWKRGDCWRRIRQLRREEGRATGEPQPASEERQIDSPRPVSRRSSSLRRWTAREDQQLFNWAGYEPVARIAERLGRSTRAVRFRLGALGMSARVRDGWSQRSLRKLLRVSPARLRAWLAGGVLRVRDPRITPSSLARFHRGLDPSSPPSLPDETENRYTWEAAAERLGTTVAEIQNLIRVGKLNMADTFVTDRAFEEFCRRHGKEINMSLLDRATAEWLTKEYGVLPGGRTVPRAQKHVLIVRTCLCGRTIAGNIFFKHRKHCSMAARKPSLAEISGTELVPLGQVSAKDRIIGFRSRGYGAAGECVREAGVGR